jgi:hypothetical protein
VIREYHPRDLARIAELHELCGFDYKLPDLEKKSFAVKRVFADQEGIHVAAFLRMTSEAYLLMDPNWRTPAFRWEALKEVHEDVRRVARDRGIEDVHCWLPPELEKRFAGRLKSLGWDRERDWPTYSRRVD